MSNNIDTDESGDSSTSNPIGGASMQASRRRLLLNSMVKGSAIAASAVPIKTLAFTSAVTAGGQICSASGVESVAHSRATSLPTCLGKSPVFFKSVSNWPGYSSPNATCRVGSVTFNQKSTFSFVFGPGSPRGGYKLIDILNSAATSDEAYWIAALLNAIRPLSTAAFPYTPSEVVALYSSSQVSSATKLFKLINLS